MANAIYKTTRDGLCVLVSPRVVDGILARGLASAGATPDTVDARTMSRLLRGTIRRDLERTLPRRGLRRSLKALDAEVRAQGGAPARDRPPAAEEVDRPASPGPDDTVPAHREVAWQLEPADVASDEARRQVFPIATDPPPVPRPTSTPAGPQPAAPPSGTVAHPVATPPAAPASAPPPRGRGPPRPHRSSRAWPSVTTCGSGCGSRLRTRRKDAVGDPTRPGSPARSAPSRACSRGTERFVGCTSNTAPGTFWSPSTATPRWPWPAPTR